MQPPGQQTRNVLIAIDLSDRSLAALEWAACEFYRRGDIFHLIHVSRCFSPQVTIQHGYTGSTYTVPDTHPVDERAFANNLKEIIKSRFTSFLDERNIPHNLHLFLDTDNAPASAICKLIERVAEGINPCILVMACHNKAYGIEQFFLGSVADYATKNLTLPVMLIRSYKPPLVIKAAARQGSK